MKGWLGQCFHLCDQGIDMFKWLTNLVDDARIAVAYLGYVRECKKQWVSDAERNFSTTHIEQEIKARMAAPLRHVASAFNTPTSTLEARRDNVRRVVSEAKDKLSILERDYKTELDTAYAALNETRAELDECRKNLSDAYDELKEAKDNLDSWYSRAEGNWFGNGGKKLPNHAFFGQDLSDRDRYKDDRDSAASDVGRYKSERSRIERHMDEARAKVKQIKDARQEMFDLKNAGFDKRIVTSAINTGNNDLHTIGEEIAQISILRDQFIHQSKLSLGVYDLEEEVERLRREKDARIKAFDNEPVKLERKAKHRAEWLAARGR
jgi:chromosome segregation ATPase